MNVMFSKPAIALLAGGIAALTLSPAAFAAAKPAKPVQRTFASARAAADAFVTAAEKFDVQALKEILGPDAIDLVLTEDSVQDKNIAASFAAMARAKLAVVPDPANPKVVTLTAGPGDWPMPIPIVQKGTTWQFDPEAGREEIGLRRIGQNELDAIQSCRNYVQAQREYASEKRDGASVNQYAQRIISTPGRQDGLGWLNADGTMGGPLAEGFARAIAEGYHDLNAPFHGYYFKILKGQGPSAPLGELDFVVQGAMIGGFALVAAPADYERTGIKTFIVSHDGVVYEKDLGPGTLEVFRVMESFNPDDTWSPIEEP